MADQKMSKNKSTNRSTSESVAKRGNFEEEDDEEEEDWSAMHASTKA
jgi:hypothetical protein